MKKVIFGLLLIAMIGYAFYEYNSSLSDTTVTSKKTPVISSNTDIEIEETNEVGIRRGNIAPNFTLETLEGEVLSLSDFKGKKYLLIFGLLGVHPAAQRCQIYKNSLRMKMF